MKIGKYTHTTWSSSLKNQVDENWMPIINGHWHSSDNLSWFDGKYTRTWHVKEWFWNWTNNEADNKNMVKKIIESGLDDYYDNETEELLVEVNWKVINLLEYEEQDDKILSTELFWNIDFRKEENEYFISRNIRFFQLLDQVKELEIKYNNKIGYWTMLIVDWYVEWKRFAETLPLWVFARLTWNEWKNFETFLLNIEDIYDLKITSKKNVKRKTNNTSFDNTQRKVV